MASEAALRRGICGFHPKGQGRVAKRLHRRGFRLGASDFRTTPALLRHSRSTMPGYSLRICLIWGAIADRLLGGDCLGKAMHGHASHGGPRVLKVEVDFRIAARRVGSAKCSLALLEAPWRFDGSLPLSC